MKYRHTKMVARQASLARGVTIGLLLAVMTALPVTGRAQQMFQPSSLFPKLSQPSSNNLSGTILCNGNLSPAGLRKGAIGRNSQENLVIRTHCTVDTAGNYVYGTVNIINNGTLEFREPATAGKINFWAENIIIENGGTLKAGTEKAPFGSRGSVLTIYLYGANQSVDANGKPADPTLKPGLGAVCNGKLDSLGANKSGPCGIPWGAWSDNGKSSNALNGTPGVGGVKDYFYQYGPLFGDILCDDMKTQWTANPDPITDQPILCGTTGQGNNKVDRQVGYFGYKVLAVSYGGSLRLFGYKGTPLAKAPRPSAAGSEAVSRE